MTQLLSAAQMRSLEEMAVARGETGAKLMERAGRAVLDALTEWRPEFDEGEHRAAVLCGPGNNGGDGFVIARFLKEAGWEVDLYLHGEERKLPSDAAVNARKWRWLRGEVLPLKAERFRPEFYDVVIDAIFGAGLSRPLGEDVAEVVEQVATARPRNFAVVAVDAPSGLCMDSGKVIGGHAMRADLTVSFQAPRPGLYLTEGPAHCGAVAVRDIGLPMATWLRAAREAEGGEPRLTLVGPPAAGRLAKAGGAHKYQHGHAVILGGPPGAGGAARLAARAALRAGAGLVTLAVTRNALAENAARLDAVMLSRLNDAGSLAGFLSDGRVTAYCVGPGYGTGKATREMVAQIRKAGRPAVLDADALTSFEKAPEELFEMLDAGCVLTPHPGEFRRLFPDLAERLEEAPTAGPAYSKVDAARAAAARSGAVVLIKGAGTVIGEPDGAVSIHAAHYERAVPWLASAGTGDVLAGIVTGLMARGMDAAEAARTGAWLHAEAGRAVGPGLIAEDLPDALPSVFRALGA